MIPVGVLGATGMVGQHYLSLLKDHPFFKLTYTSSSTTPTDEPLPPLLFNCAPNTDAIALAEAGHTVIDMRSLHRSDPRVPLLIPEVNAHHLKLLETQPWRGNLLAKPNCSLQSFVIPLAPLHHHFKIEKLSVTTLQARSGAGRDFQLEERCLPYIPNEEEKTSTEPHKILEADFPISVQCTRVPITHGHMACVSVAFETNPTHSQILELWHSLKSPDLPTAPEKPILIDESLPLTPMSVSVGRLRPCPLLHWRFVGLSHNVIRGAAGGGLLTAEVLHETKSQFCQAAERLHLSRSEEARERLPRERAQC